VVFKSWAKIGYNSYNNIIFNLLNIRQYKKCFAFISAALAINRKVLGDENYNYSGSLVNCKLVAITGSRNRRVDEAVLQETGLVVNLKRCLLSAQLHMKEIPCTVLPNL
jgi:hypothetical protein